MFLLLLSFSCAARVEAAHNSITPEALESDNWTKVLLDIFASGKTHRSHDGFMSQRRCGINNNACTRHVLPDALLQHTKVSHNTFV
jgi:hypothetical protein